MRSHSVTFNQNHQISLLNQYQHTKHQAHSSFHFSNLIKSSTLQSTSFSDLTQTFTFPKLASACKKIVQ